MIVCEVYAVVVGAGLFAGVVVFGGGGGMVVGACVAEIVRRHGIYLCKKFSQMADVFKNRKKEM